MAVFLFHYYNIRAGLIDNAFCLSLANLFKRSGYLGVDFFFTLSGFLITSILVSQTGFDLGKFYLKRGLRIIPLYVLIVLVSYLCLPYLLGQQLSLPPIGYVLSFTANLFYAVHGDRYLFAVTILWSLSVEMQFYLVWGALLSFFKRHLYLLAVVLVICSTAVKYYLYGKCSLYYLTATYVPDFMIGAIGARLIYDRVLNFGSIHKGVKLSFYLATLAVFAFTPFLNTFFWWKIGSNCVYSALTLGVIADQCSANSLFELGKNRVISYLGKVSYGIYCFQGFILPLYAKYLLPYFVDSGSMVKVLIMPIALFAITGLVARVSYRYFESYFLRLKGHI